MENYIGLNFEHSSNKYPPREFIVICKDFAKQKGKEKISEMLDISVHTVDRLLTGKYCPSKRLLKGMKQLIESEIKQAGELNYV